MHRNTNKLQYKQQKQNRNKPKNQVREQPLDAIRQQQTSQEKYRLNKEHKETYVYIPRKPRSKRKVEATPPAAKKTAKHKHRNRSRRLTSTQWLQLQTIMLACIIGSAHAIDATNKIQQNSLNKPQNKKSLVDSTSSNLHYKKCFDYKKTTNDNNLDLESNFLWSDSACKEYFVSAPVEDFISSLESVTIAIGDAANYGNQAAPINYLKRIRKMGYTGEIRVVYEDFHDGGNKDKIFRLLNLQTDNTGDYYRDTDRNITIISQEKYNSLLQNKTISPSVLAINDLGSINVGYSDYHHKDPQKDTSISYLECGNNDLSNVRVRQNQTSGKSLIVPVASFDDTLEYLKMNSAGINLVKKLPALPMFIEAIKNSTANVMPLYGNTIRENVLHNLMGFILGARYAQIHGDENLKKPFIIASFNAFSEKDLAQLKSVINDHATLFKSQSWANSKEEVSNTVPLQLQEVIRELDADKAFRIIQITDANAKDELANLQPNNIYLLALGSMPKVIFDGIFSLTQDNIITPVHEGAGTYTILLNTGRPHIHCTTYYEEGEWPINLDLADKPLRNRLLQLDNMACGESFGGYFVEMNVYVSDYNTMLDWCSSRGYSSYATLYKIQNGENNFSFYLCGNPQMNQLNQITQLDKSDALTKLEFKQSNNFGDAFFYVSTLENVEIYQEIKAKNAHQVYNHWSAGPVHKIIGGYIIDSMNYQSDISIYFAKFKKNAMLPENDRIRFGLFEAIELIKHQNIANNGKCNCDEPSSAQCDIRKMV